MIPGRQSIEREKSGCVNNTINSHRTNNYRTACFEEQTNYLKSKKQQILVIVYCRNEGTPDLFSQLLRTGVLFIPTTKRLVSKSKPNDQEQLKEFQFVRFS